MSLEGRAGAKACVWKTCGRGKVVQGKKVHVGEKEMTLEAGGREKLQGEERAPEHILHLLVSKAASDFCLESQSPGLILLDWSLESACW